MTFHIKFNIYKKKSFCKTFNTKKVFVKRKFFNYKKQCLFLETLPSINSIKSRYPAARPSLAAAWPRGGTQSFYSLLPPWLFVWLTASSCCHLAPPPPDLAKRSGRGGWENTYRCRNILARSLARSDPWLNNLTWQDRSYSNGRGTLWGQIRK